MYQWQNEPAISIVLWHWWATICNRKHFYFDWIAIIPIPWETMAIWICFDSQTILIRHSFHKICYALYMKPCSEEYFEIRNVRLWRAPYVFDAPWENRIFAYAKTKTQISFTVTARLINAFVVATRIVQCPCFLNLKYWACNHFLTMYSPVCVRPCWKPRRLRYLASWLYPRDVSLLYHCRYLESTLSIYDQTFAQADQRLRLVLPEISD